MTEITIGEPLIDLLRRAYPADLPVMLEGVHGVGKSEILQEAADRLGIKCIVMDLSLCEPMDLVGLPQFRDGRTVFAPPVQLPTDGAGLLVLEEINRAPRHVRAPCLQLLTARRLNDYRLPKGWLPVACVNPISTSDEDLDIQYDVDELDPALRSRFIQVRVHAGQAEWLDWARAHGVHPSVLDAVEHGGREALNGGDANPRAWTYASRYLTEWDADPGPEAVLIAGLVGMLGSTWGIALARIYGTQQRPFNPEDILNRYNEIQPVIESWAMHQRNDLLSATWDGLRRHLSSNVVAKSVAHQPIARRSCTSLVERLPADLKAEATKWLEHQFGAFQGPTKTGRARRGRRA